MKYLFFISCTLFIRLNFAQTFVTTANFPNTWTSVTYFGCDTTGVANPSSGLGQTFDYSTLITSSSSTFNYTNPITLWCNPVFSSSNLAKSQGFADWYYVKTADTIYLIGTCLTDSTTTGTYNSFYYKPAIDIFTNMNYAQVYNDSAHFEYDASAVREQISTFEVIASGTLQLPSSSYSNVFVLKKDVHIKKSGTGEVYEHYLEYAFYDSLLAHPVLKIIYYSDFGEPLTNKLVSYYDVSIGIPEAEKREEVKIFPNPFADEFYIEQDINSSILLYDINLKPVKFTSIKTDLGIKIQTNELEKGIYIVSSQSTNQKHHYKIIKL